MGLKLFDQYTYLHFSVGIIAYFWNVSLLNWLVIHTIFEVLENTQMAMNFINNKMFFWPGGKPRADSLTNILGDTIGTILGWLSAYLLDQIGNKYGWYNLHIK